MFVVLPGLDETAILSAFLANSMESYSLSVNDTEEAFTRITRVEEA